VRSLLVANDPPFAAQDRFAPLEDDLEPEHDPLRASLRAEENDARVGERVELSLEKLFFRRVGAGDADRDGRFELVCHGRSIQQTRRARGALPPRGDAWYRGRMRGKRVLVLGSGAREHALTWGLVRSGCEVVVAPGNAGVRSIARCTPVRVDDVDAVVRLASAAGDAPFDLVVVGPELPLTLGVVDALAARGIRAFGPTRAAARLEGSKAFMKRFCTRHGIATAAYEVFDDPAAADAYVRAAARPLVVKADGLAAGKGVVVASSTDEALGAVDRFMRKRELGDAGAVVVIEEILAGEEASFHVVCAGERFVPLEPAQDHKRIFDGDKGPNTGGMGAYAPAPIVTPDVCARVLREIVEPTLAGMAKDGAPFRGVLFVGLMIDRGEPRVLEYNVRFGDPETSVVVPLLADRIPLFDLLDGAASGDLRPAIATLAASSPSGAQEFALSVVMAAEGYPGKPRTGDAIDGLGSALEEGAYVFHAGTALGEGGAVVTAGGRVLTVGGRAATLDEAAAIAYRAVDRIHWRGEQHRRDIGYRARSRVC
jgi:phosphoribosylamine---glycine ligase